MKRIFLSFVMLLVGCSSTASDNQDAKDATESFYKSYLYAFGSDDARPYPADELRKYVSADTIARIDAIQEIYEQELIESDYFRILRIILANGYLRYEWKTQGHF